MSTKQTPKQEEQPNAWAKYEQRKSELPDDLSAKEYEAACRRIADELGI